MGMKSRVSQPYANKLQSIRKCIEQLAGKTPNSPQLWKVSPVSSDRRIAEIEDKLGFPLPDGYRQYIMSIGNGELD